MKKLILALAMLMPLVVNADFPTAWDAVTTRTDGSTATVSYYQVSCGDSTGNYTRNYSVTPGSVVTFTVPEGSQVFCAVRAFDSTNTPSAYSNEIYYAAPLSAPANFRIVIN